MCEVHCAHAMFAHAVVASSTAVSDPARARRHGIASVALSFVGIVTTVIFVVVIVVANLASA